MRVIFLSVPLLLVFSLCFAEERTSGSLLRPTARPSGVDEQQEEKIADALERMVVERSVHPETVDIMITALQSRHSPFRQHAASILGDIGDVRAVEPLIAVVQKDGNRDVRKAAARALGKLKDRRGVEPLISCLMTPSAKDDEDLCAHSLYQIGGPLAEDALIAATGPGHRNETAILTLRSIKSPRATGVLTGLLKEQNWYLRKLAAGALGGKKDDPRAADALVAALLDKDERVQDMVTESLEEIADPRTTGALVAAIGNKDYKPFMFDEWDRVSKATKPLIAIGTSTVEPLIESLHTKDRNLGINAIYALGKIKSPRAVEGLITCLKQEDLYLRKKAAAVLVKIEDRRIETAFLVAAKEKNLPVIAGAAAFFLEKGIRGTKTLLITALDAEGYPRMTTMLLNSGDEQLRQAAVAWARKRGYNIRLTGDGGYHPRWHGR
jgi:HEAT repeat protein